MEQFPTLNEHNITTNVDLEETRVYFMEMSIKGKLLLLEV